MGLDPKQVVEIRDLIRQLAKDHTVILSSHILSEIRAVCDQVLIIRKGKLVACDTPEALEGKLSAGGALELEVRADADQAAAVLETVPGITGCAVLSRVGDTARLSVSWDRDVREAVFYALADAQYPILEMRPRTASLEEAFLDLTDEDDAVAAKAAAALSGAAAQPAPEDAETREEADHDGNL